MILSPRLRSVRATFSRHLSITTKLVLNVLERFDVNGAHLMSLGFLSVVKNHRLAADRPKELFVQEQTICRGMLVHLAFNALQ